MTQRDQKTLVFLTLGLVGVSVATFFLYTTFLKPINMANQDLEVHDVESLRPHYARTLGHWSDNFEARMKQAVETAGERTARIWRVYLAGCAHAFEQGWISIHQILASKHTRPGRAAVPLTRDYMYR